MCAAADKLVNIWYCMPSGQANVSSDTVHVTFTVLVDPVMVVARSRQTRLLSK